MLTQYKSSRNVKNHQIFTFAVNHSSRQTEWYWLTERCSCLTTLMLLCVNVNPNLTLYWFILITVYEVFVTARFIGHNYTLRIRLTEHDAGRMMLFTQGGFYINRCLTPLYDTLINRNLWSIVVFNPPKMRTTKPTYYNVYIICQQR